MGKYCLMGDSWNNFPISRFLLWAVILTIIIKALRLQKNIIMAERKKVSKKRKHRYLEGRISRGFNCLYSSRMILKMAASLLGLFLPIFLYELFDYNLKYVIGYYVISYLLYVLTIAWGAKYLNKIGLRRSLRISIVWGALFYFWFYMTM